MSYYQLFSLFGKHSKTVRACACCGFRTAIKLSIAMVCVATYAVAILSLLILELRTSSSQMQGCSRTVDRQGCNRNVFRQTWPEVVDKGDGNEDIFFGLMMSFGGDYRSHGAVPAVQVALELINKDSSLLPGYTLHYTLLDSQVYII